MSLEAISFIFGIVMQTIMLAYYFGITKEKIQRMQEDISDIRQVADKASAWMVRSESLEERIRHLERSKLLPGFCLLLYKLP